MPSAYKIPDVWRHCNLRMHYIIWPQQGEERLMYFITKFTSIQYSLSYKELKIIMKF